jgi:hypothetical protein
MTAHPARSLVIAGKTAPTASRPSNFLEPGGPGVFGHFAQLCGHWAYNNASTGSFRLVANEVPSNTGTYSRLNVNGSNTGDLHAAGDQDFHRITLTY